MGLTKSFTAAWFAACLVTAAPAVAQQAAPNPDHAFGLIGTWKCESAANSRGTMRFTRDASGSISLKHDFETADGISGEFNETYRLDSATARWEWSSTLRSAPDFEESGSAGPWTADTWIFDGTQQQGQTTEPIRMVYTKLSDSSFQREIQVQVNGGWLPRSASSCTRGSGVAEAASISDLRKHMTAAALGVKSFRLQLSSPMGMTSVATVTMKPIRMHMQVASGPIVMEMYLADGYLYQRIGNGGWQKQPLPSTAALPVDSIKALTQGTSMTAGPDVTEGGVTYGSYDVSVATASIPGAPAAGPISLSCTYDKSTFLTHECKSRFVTETFLDYNDPGNVVTLPADLSTATELPKMSIPTPSQQPTK